MLSSPKGRRTDKFSPPTRLGDDMNIAAEEGDILHFDGKRMKVHRLVAQKVQSLRPQKKLTLLRAFPSAVKRHVPLPRNHPRERRRHDRFSNSAACRIENRCRR